MAMTKKEVRYLPTVQVKATVQRAVLTIYANVTEATTTAIPLPYSTLTQAGNCRRPYALLKEKVNPELLEQGVAGTFAESRVFFLS